MKGEFFACYVCKGSGKVKVSVKDPEIFGTGIGTYTCFCIECSGMGRLDWITYIKKDKPKLGYDTVICEYQRFIQNKEVINIEPYRSLHTYYIKELEWKDLYVQNVMVKEESKL